ncbi:epoxyqueuosine reductase QueH [Oscillospiraceae bacterium Marseille-Q3528]|nr:epoxyqueuosine reductase QueH [Oscillospiraceae bacterium Marseille-Q3528]
MTKRNYQKELDAVIEQVTKEGRVPSLLLHSCCGPCSSYVLEYLSRYFAITVFYYNPNIYPPEEYEHRVKEQQRFIAECTFDHPVQFVAGDYEPELFYDAVRTLEDCPEGGERCFVCYRLRLAEAAKLADELGFDYFTTTLSISPHKNAAKLNEIGEELAGITKARHLPSDFKKRGGYKRSVELSAEHGMYRQDYCGCVFSKRERERQQQEKAQERNES